MSETAPKSGRWVGIWNRSNQLIGKVKDPAEGELYPYLRMGFTVGPVSPGTPLFDEPCPTCGHRPAYKWDLDRLPADDIDARNARGGAIAGR
jgi:hypothetical protein